MNRGDIKVGRYDMSEYVIRISEPTSRLME